MKTYLITYGTGGCDLAPDQVQAESIPDALERAKADLMIWADAEVLGAETYVLYATELDQDGNEIESTTDAISVKLSHEAGSQDLECCSRAPQEPKE